MIRVSFAEEGVHTSVRTVILLLEIEEEAATWNQLLRSSSDGPGIWIAEQSDTKRCDQIRQGQAGAAETGSIRVNNKIKKFSLLPPRPACPDDSRTVVRHIL